jgi:hypothetical protein
VIWAGGQVEVPPAEPALVRALLDSAARAGLAPESEPFADGGRGDRLELGSASSPWRIRVPLAPGFVQGFFEPSALDLAAPAAQDFLCDLFDVHQCDWGLAGDEAEVRPLFEGVAPPAPGDAARLPGFATVTYLSPDLAPRLDPAVVTDVDGLRAVRTVSGGVLVAAGAAGAGAVAALRERCPGALEPWPRPRIDAYPRDGGAPLLMRDASEALVRELERGAAEAAGLVAHRLGRRPPLTIEGLKLLESTLEEGRGSGEGHTQFGARAREGLSIFAGEVARRAGGRWRRVMDPMARFPRNLVVVLPRGIAFPAHRLLEDALESGSAAALSSALRERLRDAGAAPP